MITSLILLAGTTHLLISDDFISHVEETLMTVTDNQKQSETIQELEDVYAYGDKSRFQDMFFDLNKYYRQDDEYYEYDGGSSYGDAGDTSIRDDEFEYFTKIDKNSITTLEDKKKENSGTITPKLIERFSSQYL